MAGLGSTPELVIGIAAGAAASAALEPALEIPKQDAWASAPNRILNEGLLAQLVAKGGVDLSTAHYFAHRNGIDDDQFGALVYLSQTVPGLSEAFDLWRKGLIGTDLFTHVLVHAGIDQRYIDPLTKLKNFERVGLGDIAYGIVRGILPAPSYVPVPPPTGGTSVPRFPPLDIDPETLAAQIGFSPEMLHLLVGRSGLSLAPGLAAQALFRGLINNNDFLLAIAEGDLRTEWAETLRDASRQILTAGEYAELELRGFLDAPTRRTLTARHGMSQADSDRLYDVKGRAPAVHDITVGLARGAQYPGDYSMVPEPYRAAIQRSDIRPEFADIAYLAHKYGYPSAFVLRGLAQSGDLGGQAAVEQVLLEIGWKPSFAHQVSTAWTTGPGGDTHVAKAQTQLWTTTHRSYIGHEISDATATTALEAAGVNAAAAPAVLTLWQHERDLIRKQLSAQQIKKEWYEQVIDPTTGAPLTQQQAVARLMELGYDQAEAQTLLEL